MKKLKTILVYVTNEFAACEMASVLIEKKNYYKVKVIIEYADRNQIDSLKNIKKIFKFFTNDIYLFKLNLRIRRFNLGDLFRSIKAYSLNSNLKNKVLKYHKDNNIDCNTFDEVWFTNDVSSKFTCINFKKEMRYFFHALIDIRLLEKINIFKFLIREIGHLVDFYLFSLIKLKNGVNNIKFYSLIDSSLLWKRYFKPNIVNFNSYIKCINKIYKNNKINTKIKKQTILINIHSFLVGDKKIIESYSNLLSSSILLNLKKDRIDIRKFSLILKSKSYFSKKNQNIMLNSFKNNLKKKDIYLFTDISSGHLPLEICALLVKPKIYISLNTTSDWITKKLLPKTIYYDVSPIFISFWYNYNFLTPSHRLIIKSMVKFNNFFKLGIKKLYPIYK